MRAIGIGMYTTKKVYYLEQEQALSASIVLPVNVVSVDRR